MPSWPWRYSCVLEAAAAGRVHPQIPDYEELGRYLAAGGYAALLGVSKVAYRSVLYPAPRRGLSEAPSDGKLIEVEADDGERFLEAADRQQEVACDVRLTGAIEKTSPDLGSPGRYPTWLILI